eukprot:7055461-Prymnesium_polylepis.2
MLTSVLRGLRALGRGPVERCPWPPCGAATASCRSSSSCPRGPSPRAAALRLNHLEMARLARRAGAGSRV